MNKIFFPYSKLYNITFLKYYYTILYLLPCFISVGGMGVSVFVDVVTVADLAFARFFGGSSGSVVVVVVSAIFANSAAHFFGGFTVGVGAAVTGGVI